MEIKLEVSFLRKEEKDSINDIECFYLYVEVS